MNGQLQNILNQIDSFGFSENYGLVDTAPANRLARAVAKPTNYSVNPAIQNAGAGASTFQVTVTVAKTGTGSGNAYNPVYLFGGDAFNNTSKGYTAVQVNSPVQATALAFTANKNVITFTYAASEGNFATYTVSLATKGEYPFILSALTGKKKMRVIGLQMTVSDAAHVAQLERGISTFMLDEFGKADTNDLSTPKDLYQQQTNGIYIPHQYDISGRNGIVLNVNETNGMVLNLYFSVDKNPAGACGC